MEFFKKLDAYIWKGKALLFGTMVQIQRKFHDDKMV